MARQSPVTGRILLSHMQGMQQNMKQHMQDMEQRLNQRIDKLDLKVDRLDEKLGRKIDLLSVQIGNIDERLDDIEVVQLPKLKKATRMR
jgi:hypothetical protein